MVRPDELLRSARKPQVCIDKLWIRGQLSSRPIHYDRSSLEDIGSVRDLKGRSCVLFDQQNRHALRAQLADDLKDFLHNAGRKTQARFIEHEQLRTTHQGAANRKHLALATG